LQASVEWLGEAKNMPGWISPTSTPDSNQPLMPRSPIRKAEAFAISPIALPCHSPRQGQLFVCLSRPIQVVSTRLRLEWSAQRPSPNSFPQRCRLMPFPPQMCSSSLCTVARLSRCCRRKIRSKTRIVGSLAPPAVRTAGRFSLNGSGTSVENSDNTFLLRPCV